MFRNSLRLNKSKICLTLLLILCVWMTSLPAKAIDGAAAGNQEPAADGTQTTDQTQNTEQQETAGQTSDQSQTAVLTEDQIQITAQTETAVTTDVTKTGTSKKKSIKSLEKSLRAAIGTYGGTWSVYVKNLKTNESITINNKKMYAASLIKLYAMAGAYDRVYAKKLSLSSVSGLLSSMITVSDNESFNTIVRKVGKKRLNKWIKKNGFKKTAIVHDVGLASNSTIVRDGRKCNTTTVKDCGKLLEMIYRGKCVSKKYSKLMLNLLKKQQRLSKIPAGVPAGVVVANKTGETDETCHDAAIVYAKKAPYILVVMVTDPGAAWTHDTQIAEISAMVYQFMKKKK